ncbi:hypothetical protein [Brevibacillus porteri]|uniref:hypothetical protein n=1 Tax=Brevibacillus porteri TaxID=2126350 RepID=UPI003643D28C
MKLETRQIYIDRYNKYGERAVPESIRLFAEGDSRLQAYQQELVDFGPGGAGVKIVKAASRAVITSINGEK